MAFTEAPEESRILHLLPNLNCYFLPPLNTKKRIGVFKAGFEETRQEDKFPVN